MTTDIIVEGTRPRQSPDRQAYSIFYTYQIAQANSFTPPKSFKNRTWPEEVVRKFSPETGRIVYTPVQQALENGESKMLTDARL